LFTFTFLALGLAYTSTNINREYYYRRLIAYNILCGVWKGRICPTLGMRVRGGLSAESAFKGLLILILVHVHGLTFDMNRDNIML
jgi:hypothetical protein